MPDPRPDTRVEVLHGCAIEELDLEPDGSVQMCVTSPPYFGLRSYLPEGHPMKRYEIGTEKTPQEYVAKLVQVFRAVRRVLADDGLLFVNLGDSYSGSGKGVWDVPEERKSGIKETYRPSTFGTKVLTGLPAKNLIGIPWRVAFALQDDGWILRQDIIWAKPNPMPSSVKDRCTSSHEYIFMLSKKPRYYYDAEAIRNAPSEALLKQVVEGYNGTDTKDFAESGAQSASGTKARIIENARKKIDKQRGHSRLHEGFNGRWDAMTRAEQMMLGSNKRSVWTVATAPFKGSHFATFPPELIRPCILAGSRSGDTVLDPFGGSGTTAMVARQEGRNALLVELNEDYLPLISKRIA